MSLKVMLKFVIMLLKLETGKCKIMILDDIRKKMKYNAGADVALRIAPPPASSRRPSAQSARSGGSRRPHQHSESYVAKRAVQDQLAARNMTRKYKRINTILYRS